MSFDLIAKNRSIRPEDYFRKGGGGWHPLWQFVKKHCSDIITEEDFELGQTNNGHFISEDKTNRIAVRLEQLVNEGVIESFYAFDEEDINEFIEFCKKSKGFWIE